MNPKRQLLIDTALNLFYKNGINSIGINEVISVSGIAKRTLYSHFESKEA
ncbi:TPA: TetR/AcrR family transcriptional regulator, partial [Vibrio cholerae]